MQSTLLKLSCGVVFALAVAAMSLPAQATGGGSCAVTDTDNCNGRNTEANTEEIWGDEDPLDSDSVSRIDQNEAAAAAAQGTAEAAQQTADQANTAAGNAQIDAAAAQATALGAQTSANGNSADIDRLNNEVYGDADPSNPDTVSRIDLNSDRSLNNAGNILELQGDVEDAAADASAALNAAGTAQADADAALVLADDAAADASAALDAANAAQTTADEAESAASNAQTTANNNSADIDRLNNEVYGDADPNDPDAVSRIDHNEADIAENAGEIANLNNGLDAATGLAQSAYDDAADAQEAADAAQGAADAAQSTADAAAGAASTAQETADAAQEAADAAQSTADAAAGAASTAQETADAAQSTADAAADAASTAQETANEAKDTADAAQQEIWGNNAPGQESRIDVNSFLTSKHANDINNLEGDMNALEGEFDGVRDTANEARDTANAVADTANEALNTANGAAADAGNALTAANAAQSTANNNQSEIWGDADPNDPNSVSRIDRNEAVSENNASSISALGVDVTRNTQDIATNTEEIFVGGDTTGPSRITMNELRLDDLAASLQGFEHRLGGLEDRVNEMQKDIDRVGAITMALDNPGMPDAGAGKVALYGGAATVSGQVGFGLGLNYQVTDSLRIHGGGGTDIGGHKWAAKVGGVFTLN